MDESKLVGGPGGVGTLKNPGDENKKFGDLPPKLREKILQAKNRGFPPGYEKALRDYYKRLAEQKTGEKKPIEPPKKK